VGVVVDLGFDGKSEALERNFLLEILLDILVLVVEPILQLLEFLDRHAH